nr:reverse transcriptase domain-containing protein [Tanacetum cinerariifolium]GFB84621.1 reverse transcriptase domain-containing protein [Tanacetum cinerariifolium]
MPTATRTKMTPAAIEEMIERLVEEALEAYQNHKPTREIGDGQGDDNGNKNENGNEDGGKNGNRNGLGRGNGNGNPIVNVRGVVPATRVVYGEMWHLKRVGHITRDCRALFSTATQEALKPNHKFVTCYECVRQGHYKSDCPKLKNQNNENRSRNKPNKARGRAYTLGGGGANPDSNVVISTFLLNNHCARMLFDLGADRSFVSTTFSVLLDIVPSTLYVSYAIELANGRITESNTFLRGFTLGLLSHPVDIDLIPVEL